ncbi:MAG: hypothetical protein H6R18_1313 [Proteobacteria bacterium]|nr:hypothetical protein [Pseudomonadota bacterium]
MGLFDQVASALGGGASEGGNSSLAMIMQLVNNPKIGGIGGLIGKLQQGGLSEVVGSWVSTGENLPVSADQLSGALGSDTIASLANSMGVSNEEASGSLAELLPQVVDKLTPDGQVPEGDLMSQGLDMLKGKFFGQ